MKYELLLFDADDTLFDYDKAESNALRLSFQKYGLNFNEIDCLSTYHKINKNIWEDLEKKIITPEELKAERFRRLFENLRIDSVSPKKFSDTYLKFLSEQTFLLPDVEYILDKLKNKFIMAIITNGLKEVQRPRISSSSISHYFDDYIISDEIGLVKPDIQFFDYTLDKLNYEDKKKVLIIGDNLSSDIQGGINSGIDTCWFNWKDKPVEKNIKATYIISILNELVNIVM